MSARHGPDGTLHDLSSPDGAYSRCTRRAFLAALMPGVVLAARAFAQPSGERREQFRQRSEAAERTGLAEPFTGITTDGQVVPGLFPIQSTGVSTAPSARRRSSSSPPSPPSSTPARCFPSTIPSGASG